MNAPNPKNASITLVGPGMRIDGKVDFVGVLRVNGEVAGDVTSRDPAQGMLVVEDAGRIAGAVVASRVVLKGQVLGTVQSRGLVEVHRGGRVCGDIVYRQVDVRSGGVVEGKLTLAETPTGDAPAALTMSTADTFSDAMPTGERRRPRVPAWSAAALAVAVAAYLWMRPTDHKGEPAGVQNIADAAAPAAEKAADTPPAVPVAAPAPPGAGAATASPVTPPTSPAPSAPPAAAPVATPSGPSPAAAQAAPAAPAARQDTGRIVTVQGTNAEKSASQFYVTTREAVVIHRRKRGDAGEGKPVEIAKNRNTSIQIGAGEVFRVVQGRDVDIFYQGRRVSKSNIDNGDWLSFVPITGG